MTKLRIICLMAQVETDQGLRTLEIENLDVTTLGDLDLFLDGRVQVTANQEGASSVASTPDSQEGMTGVEWAALHAIREAQGNGPGQLALFPKVDRVAPENRPPKTRGRGFSRWRDGYIRSDGRTVRGYWFKTPNPPPKKPRRTRSDKGVKRPYTGPGLSTERARSMAKARWAKARRTG